MPFIFSSFQLSCIDAWQAEELPLRNPNVFRKGRPRLQEDDWMSCSLNNGRMGCGRTK